MSGTIQLTLTAVQDIFVCVSKQSCNLMRVFVAVFGLVGGPAIALAVPVTWEAQGSVEFSDLSPAFFASFMPELAGTQAGDDLVLRITFDTDAPLIGQTTHPSGGTTFSFDASALVLALEVPRLGTHVFTIDDTVPPATIPSLVGITDDLVTPGTPTFDSLQFRHNYLAEAGALQFFVLAVFSTTDYECPQRRESAAVARSAARRRIRACDLDRRSREREPLRHFYIAGAAAHDDSGAGVARPSLPRLRWSLGGQARPRGPRRLSILSLPTSRVPRRRVDLRPARCILAATTMMGPKTPRCP